MRKNFLLILIVGWFGVADAQTDSLLKVVTESKVDSLQYKALLDLSKIYVDSGDVGFTYINQAIEVAKRMDDKERVGVAYHRMGAANFRKGNLQLAIDNLNQALKYVSESSALEVGGILNDIGLAYKSMGKYDIALSFHIKSLKNYLAVNNEDGAGIAYNNIGQIYYYQSDYKRAIAFFTKYRDINKNAGRAAAVAGSENNIGGAFSEMGNLKQAMVHYTSARSIYDSLNIGFGVAIIDDNIGSILYRLGDYKKALGKHTSSYLYFKSKGMKERMVFTQHNIGLANMGLGNYVEAEKNLIQAQELAKSIGQAEGLKLLSESLSQVFAKTGQFEKSLKAYKEYTALKDSLSGEETQTQIAEIQAKYESEKKEEELKKQKEQLANQQKMLVGGSVAIFCFIVLSSLLVVENRNKKKAYVALESEQRKITESITYASKIQAAVLPPHDLIRQYLPEHFIFFLPRDIVSGDFYWFSVNKNRVYFAAVDCTGHGVPGAFMSMLGFTMLNQIVSANENLTAAEILNRLREDVKEALHQKGNMNEPHDGMDLALCVLDTDDNTLQFSGARNPLYLIRYGELIQYSGDLMPIGHAGKLELRPFTNHLIQLQKDDMVYLFSDGYTDQFGGESGQKFKRTLFKKTLLAIHKEPLDSQVKLLKETLDSWKLNYEQVDDILVLGIRF